MWRQKYFCWLVSERTGISKNLCQSVLSGLEEQINKKLLPAYKTRFVFADYSEDKIILNMNSSIRGKILANVAWGCKIMEDYLQNPEMQPSSVVINAFMQTIGHELGHLTDKSIPYCLSHIKFRLHISEIYADFYSASLFSSDCRRKTLKAMLYKLHENSRFSPDIGDCCHPALRKRMYYIRYWDFTEELIRYVAKDCDCVDESYIEKIIKHYHGKWMYLK